MVGLGQVDLKTLLSDEEIVGQLHDAGRTRDYSQEYTVTETASGRLRVKGGNKAVEFDRYHELDPSLLIFLGLYGGDGDKTGSVGFGQKSIDIMEHAYDEMVEFFGHEFDVTYHITEDSLFFESDEMQAELEAMDHDGEPLEKKKQYLIDEVWEMLEDRGMHVDSVTATVSDVKGARKAGQSSREDLIDLRGSKPFLPIILKLIEGVTATLSDDLQSYPSDDPWLEWNDNPSDLSAYEINIPDYVENAETCQYYTGSGKLRQYKIEKNYDGVTTLRKPYGQTFDVHSVAEIGPHFLYIAGLYMAEGGTPKEVLVSFYEEPSDTSLSIEFVSTENEELEILIDGFNSVCEDFDDFLNYWKVKIGSQYMYETGNAAEKIGAPVLRSGTKGQGKSRSFEVAEGIKKWGIKTFPALGEIEQFFSHIELTGAGIPRWHIAFSSSPAVLFFALMNDLAFYPERVEHYEVSKDE
ncbi:hypothetical protein [Halobacterium litoreum]|uniref:Uncharacterized protein n=1 Tax=Halobacterium litoreum TaxID=2039234 RepID=A0ABD5NG26_9EURY|nr:hypothetical protein [Halobacterium litoreum]UHH13199.1 hypothetical protein LT972_13710 [Halobacterium litoreum]